MMKYLVPHEHWITRNLLNILNVVSSQNNGQVVYDAQNEDDQLILN